MKESHSRSIFKAVSYRICGSIATVLISWALSHKIALALTIGAGDFFAKIAVYYFHERLWDRISFGKKQARIEYEI